MARRLGDPRLVRDACQVAFVTLWVMPTAEERLALATESMELARELGDERGFVVSATLRTVVLGELGRRREMLAAAEVARAEARAAADLVRRAGARQRRAALAGDGGTLRRAARS